GGTINIVFTQDPAASGVHWGLRWAGDHSAELQDLADVGKLTWDDTAMTSPAAIIVHGGNTYVGVAVAMASITQFTVADATSGSSLVTNAADVTVTITAEPAEGAAIVGYVVNETGVEPTEGWVSPLTSYTIQGASDSDVTLYAWTKDSAGNVASKSAVIYFNTTVPAVSDLVISDNGDGTVTATWTTDIPAEGSAKYGPVSLIGATPNTAPGAGLTTSHTATLTGIAAGTNYKIVLVNTEAASEPVFWPRPWPIDGDANMDCRVNILDLIFIRNKLNQPVGTGDNWKADVNEDTRINILDLIFVRNKLNTQCP
ncbi:MAG TPA: dockerin type I repeat-containing protein, partial [Planctomycetota bacterium]|nr:dockerin type I repeat-containing protein [Planctomycetota bacterium]